MFIKPDPAIFMLQRITTAVVVAEVQRGDTRYFDDSPHWHAALAHNTLAWLVAPGPPHVSLCTDCKKYAFVPAAAASVGRAGGRVRESHTLDRSAPGFSQAAPQAYCEVRNRAMSISGYTFSGAR